jgi:hypothetical protein
VTTGELTSIWQAWAENWKCGCGSPVTNCAFWSEVVKKAFGGFSAQDARRLWLLQRLLDRPHYATALLAPGGARLLNAIIGGSDYWERLAALLRAACSASGASIVVDSDKYPTHPVFLRKFARVSVIHLVRDPRAVFYSWQRKKVLRYKPGHLERPGLLRSALVWNIMNRAALKLERLFLKQYMLVRYEDMVNDPRTVLRRITELAGVRPTDINFLRNESALLNPNHGIGGNPARLNTGSVQLVSDDEWKSKMEPIRRLLAGALCMPHMLKYGYTFYEPYIQ